MNCGKGLKPKLPQVAERLLDRVIKRLEEQISHCVLGETQIASGNLQAIALAIEPPDHTSILKQLDVLIDGCSRLP